MLQEIPRNKVRDSVFLSGNDALNDNDIEILENNAAGDLPEKSQPDMNAFTTIESASSLDLIIDVSTKSTRLASLSGAGEGSTSLLDRGASARIYKPPPPPSPILNRSINV